MSRILLLEDDKTISMGLEYYLNQEGFTSTVCHTIKDATKCINDDSNYDLLLLDLTLPDGHGFDFYKTVKKIKDYPVIFLTALDDEVNIVMGLDMGADDYITKPFKARELISRIKSVLRRYKSGEINNTITIKNLTININQAKVTKNGKDVFLTALEYKILLILATNPNQVFTREEILANIWDVNEEYVNDNTLTVYIKRLREKIEDDDTNPKIIETVRGIGYRMVI